MNIIHFAKRLVDFLLVKKSFSYVVQRSPQECLELLRGWTRPKTGFVNAVSQTVMLSQEERYFYFELCVKRYGRGGEGNSVIGIGTITATIDNTKTTIIVGHLRHSLPFLIAQPIVFILPIIFIILRIDLFWEYFGVYVLWFAAVIFYRMRTYSYYQRLENFIHEAFSKDNILANKPF